MVPYASVKCVYIDELMQGERNFVVSLWAAFLCSSYSLDPDIALRVAGDVELGHLCVTGDRCQVVIGTVECGISHHHHVLNDTLDKSMVE